MLHEPAAKRVGETTFTGPGMVEFLRQMAADAAANNQESEHVCITFIEPDDEFAIGSYVPEIHLILRRVDDDTD